MVCVGVSLPTMVPGWVWCIYRVPTMVPTCVPGSTMRIMVPALSVQHLLLTLRCQEKEPWALFGRKPWVGREEEPRDVKSVSLPMFFSPGLLRSSRVERMHDRIAQGSISVYYPCGKQVAHSGTSCSSSFDQQRCAE